MVNKKQLNQSSPLSLAAADNAKWADGPAGAVAMRQDRCVPRWGHEGREREGERGREKQQLHCKTLELARFLPICWREEGTDTEWRHQMTREARSAVESPS